MQDLITRRQLLQHLGLIAAGLAAAACTPARILVNAYPQRWDDDPALVDRVLAAFAATVVPGGHSDADAARALTDPDYPFGEYAAFFAADLARRGRERFGEPAFERLDLAQRAAVIREGLAADATTRRLYGGAITLVQVACYAGIYDATRGCPLIGFEGGYHWHPLSEITYAEPDRFLAAALTPDGNAA